MSAFSRFKTLIITLMKISSPLFTALIFFRKFVITLCFFVYYWFVEMHIGCIKIRYEYICVYADAFWNVLFRYIDSGRKLWNSFWLRWVSILLRTICALSVMNLFKLSFWTVLLVLLLSKFFFMVSKIFWSRNQWRKF